MSRILKSPFVRLTGYYVLLGAAVWSLTRAVPAVPRTLRCFRAVSALSVTNGKRVKDLEVMAPADSGLLAHCPELASNAGVGLEALPQQDLALVTLLSMLGALALVLPVAWVYMITKQHRGYDQSVVQTVIILPMTVAGTVILVQNSLALAFALAAIVAVVRFRNTLKDTKDTVYIFLALGVGVAAGVFAPTVGGVMSVMFNFVVLALWSFNFGNIYADQGLAGRMSPAQALVGPGKTGEYSVIGDPDLLRALAPEELDKVAAASDRLGRYIKSRAERKKKPFTAVLLVHATQLEGAQRATEAVLDQEVKRWRLAEIQPTTDDKSTLQYLVRLSKNAVPAELLEHLKTRGAPHVIAAEYRSLRGFAKDG
ncbi:MAG: hypothetical protein DMD49_07850 [Gemmatimonadetes bacterium]|nr:MAG: hypothetical protein DMD49_07850 [Gemmatimonadota bacterium]